MLYFFLKSLNRLILTYKTILSFVYFTELQSDEKKIQSKTNDDSSNAECSIEDESPMDCQGCIVADDVSNPAAGCRDEEQILKAFPHFDINERPSNENSV